MQSRTFQLHIATFPYFRNDSIDRKLTAEAINAIIHHMIKLGNAEWDGETDRGNVRVLWKSVQTLANEIYDWAGRQEGYGTVYTIYELCSSDEVADTPFHGTDPGMVRRALQQLENNHKVTTHYFVFQNITYTVHLVRYYQWINSRRRWCQISRTVNHIFRLFSVQAIKICTKSL